MNHSICAQQVLLPDGWAHNIRIEIDNKGIIASVQAAGAGVQSDVDTLLPAPANLHSHAFQRAMAGLTEKRGPNANDSFWTWRKLMYRFLDQLTPADVESITTFVQMQMLEAGYACNVEFHYLHHQTNGKPYGNLAEMSERIIAASQTSGIGLTLLPVLYQYGGCDKRELGNGQKRFGNDIDNFAKLHSDCASAIKRSRADNTLGIAAHSLRAVAPQDIKHLSTLVGANPIHMHLAEQAAEVDEVKAAYGLRPVEWVLENMPIDSQYCFIHCTQMLPHETKALAQSGAIAGLCPITESNLGDGIFDCVNWLNTGGKLGIGSDSNIRIGLTEEMRVLENSQRLRDQTRASLATKEKSTARRILDEINAGGALAAGRKTGAIAPGYQADLTSINSECVELLGQSGDTLLDCFVFAGDDRLIEHVWSGGRHVVKNGQHINKESITASYIKTMQALSKII